MTPLLLSFCYAKPSGYVLARMDPKSRAFAWVDMSDVPWPVVGATGLCRSGGRCYAALQIRVPGTVGTVLAELDAAARVRRFARLPEVFDAHSLIAWQDELLIVSSGTNQVFAVEWPDDGVPRVRCFFEREPGADTLHMNALQVFNGSVYLSMFGCKPGASWRDACDGQVLDLGAGGAIVRRGLRHPHSLFVDRGTLLCLSSRDGSLIHIAGAPRGADKPLDGYVRGALAAGGRLYVGCSMARTHSKSRGVREAHASASPGSGCGLHVIDMGTGAAQWHDLSAFGAELYDVLEWTGAPLQGAPIDAMKQRLQAVNAQFGELIGAMYRMRTQHGLVAGMLRGLLDGGTDLRAAGAVLEQLANDPPALPEWSYLHARLLLAGEGDPRAALPYLMSALDGGYDSFDVLRHLARVYDAVQAHPDAARHARKALAIAPGAAPHEAIDELRRIAEPFEN